MRLKNKVAIVTGAASGFGAGMARRFAAEGAKVIVADITEDAGRAIAADIGDAAHFVRCDVTSADDWNAAVATTCDKFGRLDIVVNNAGYTHLNRPMLEVAEDEYDRIFAVNVKALYLSAQAALPVFRAQGGGQFLNIASTAGVRPRPGLVWYNSSKAAAIGVTRSMAIELAPEQIRVNAINPVAGETPLLTRFMGEDTPEKRAQFKASVPLGRLSTADDIAGAAVYLCSDDASLVTGVCMEVDGGTLHLMSDGNGPHHLKTTPVVLKPDMTTERRDATKSDFYPALDADFGGFRGHALISQYTFESDWGMWEMHPKGDETIVLMSGCVEFVYVVGADTVSVTLNEPGDYVVIPMGAWHTANTSVPTSALFVTPGEGTEHASAPPA